MAGGIILRLGSEAGATIDGMPPWPGIIEAFRPLIDLPADAAAVSLMEGNTPLIPVPRIAYELGAQSVHIKFEGLNPTGSFKDRGMTVAVSECLYRQVQSVICASTGNTAASAAAYAARAGMSAWVVIPRGQVAAGKLAGAAAYGARIVQVDGSFDDALRVVRQVVEDSPIVALVNSLNPYRLEGQKTVAFEICESLGDAPDWLALPVGNAGNITAAWGGFQAYAQQRSTRLPRFLGVQAAGAAPLVVGHDVDEPDTLATAIRIGKPARGAQALEAASSSGGRIVAVADDAILQAQDRLASEGIWVEPASAAGLAGLFAEARQGRLELGGASVVCICTGHGLKDPAIIADRLDRPQVIPPEAEALRALVEA